MKITNWKMDYEEHIGLDCEIPCSMYTVLLNNGLIDDPFYGLNDLKATALSEKNCTFYTEFQVSDDVLQNKYIYLVMGKLDTICRIYLNGELLAKTKNMFREYSFDVKERLLSGKNTLKIEISSPIKYFEYMNNKHWLFTNLDSIEGSPHLRKALCMSGWDWGPALPDMGIYAPVYIDAYNVDKIADVNILQYHTENRVELEIGVDTAQKSDCDIYVKFENREYLLKNGETCITVDNPKLWWVRGYGEQPLYDLEVYLKNEGQIIDSQTQRIGLRTITVSTKRDKLGSELCFVNNGVKIFAMGANYIPIDSLVPRITTERIKNVILQAIDGNCNCLRVWGGGYYPEDEFYDLCDEYGILVWQDFMSACVDIHMTEDMRNELREEAVYNIKRLRNHPSLGLLCGNNEWEWQSSRKDMKAQVDYLELYEKLFPDMCEKYAPQVFYRPSSPSSDGGFEEPNAFNHGDVHYWDIWVSNADIDDYYNYTFRFCSEYGFESFPSMKTINTFCEKEDQNCFSEVMENHQKCRSGNTKIMIHISKNYLYPSSFENLVYTSQLLQAEAIKKGAEYFRRQRGICMGSIYWQLNDCYPVASWSSFDYYGRPKAQHFASKKFYAPTLLSMYISDGILTVNISNEKCEGFVGRVVIRVCDNNFNVIEEYNQAVSVTGLTAKDIWSDTLNMGDGHSRYVYADLYDENEKLIMRQTELSVPPKHYKFENPNITTEFEKVAKGIKIKLKANCFAKGVYVDFEGFDCKLSDNFIDIVNDKEHFIIAETDKTVEEMKESILIKTVYDISR